MATSKIKKGDTVKVIAGKDKGREGKVTSVKDGKVIIEGINQVTKAYKAKSGKSSGRHRSEVSSSGYFKRNVCEQGKGFPCWL